MIETWHVIDISFYLITSLLVLFCLFVSTVILSCNRFARWYQFFVYAWCNALLNLGELRDCGFLKRAFHWQKMEMKPNNPRNSITFVLISLCVESKKRGELFLHCVVTCDNRIRKFRKLLLRNKRYTGIFHLNLARSTTTTNTLRDYFRFSDFVSVKMVIHLFC